MSSSSTHILPDRVLGRLASSYRSLFDLRVYAARPDGLLVQPARVAQMLQLPVLRRARAYALDEAVRWGEANTVFLAPGLLSWIVPVVDGDRVLGGLTPDVVRLAGDDDGGEAAVRYLAGHGAGRSAAARFVAKLPRLEQDRIREAGVQLREDLYAMTGWKPYLLWRNRARSMQQRRIAESMQEQKEAPKSGVDRLAEERMLLSLIRVGDRSGARGVLNDMLAALFLYSPKVPVIKARLVELMGYLVRAAIEDNAALEFLLERHQAWLTRILEANTFEDLCVTAQSALDDFIGRIERQGYNRTSEPVRRTLDYIGTHYRQRLTLDEVATEVGLSRFRLGHLVREVTGQSLFQHVKRLRVAQARHLLESGERTCADIAYELGFADQGAFIRQFRELTGTTPARYRRARSTTGR